MSMLCVSSGGGGGWIWVYTQKLICTLFVVGRQGYQVTASYQGHQPIIQTVSSNPVATPIMAILMLSCMDTVITT